jgi:hypothetical protein
VISHPGSVEYLPLRFLLHGKSSRKRDQGIDPFDSAWETSHGGHGGNGGHRRNKMTGERGSCQVNCPNEVRLRKVAIKEMCRTTGFHSREDKIFIRLLVAAMSARKDRRYNVLQLHLVYTFIGRLSQCIYIVSPFRLRQAQMHQEARLSSRIAFRFKTVL